MTRDDALTTRSLVVLYDGDCAMCDAARCWIERRDHGQRVQFQAISDTDEVRGRRFIRADLDAEMHVVDAGGRVYRGFSAWLRVAAELRSLSVVAGFVHALVPERVGALVYRWIARHRRTLSRCLRFNLRRNP
jgi:predicted DCC family thiol-disulfide oxidoreductase YuxK